jgi:hypothetical protein
VVGCGDEATRAYLQDRDHLCRKRRFDDCERPQHLLRARKRRSIASGVVGLLCQLQRQPCVDIVGPADLATGSTVILHSHIRVYVLYGEPRQAYTEQQENFPARGQADPEGGGQLPRTRTPRAPRVVLVAPAELCCDLARGTTARKL